MTGQHEVTAAAASTRVPCPAGVTESSEHTVEVLPDGSHAQHRRTPGCGEICDGTPLRRASVPYCEGAAA